MAHSEYLYRVSMVTVRALSLRGTRTLETCGGSGLPVSGTVPDVELLQGHVQVVTTSPASARRKGLRMLERSGIVPYPGMARVGVVRLMTAAKLRAQTVRPFASVPVPAPARLAD